MVQNGGCISTGSAEGMKLSKGHEIERHSPMAFNSHIGSKACVEDFRNRCEGGKKRSVVDEVTWDS